MNFCKKIPQRKEKFSQKF
uniref:Uncharacterized protein n=1 Tax=Arundo donax TaxID=35708 RepID=A0A0A9BJX7_ARUDO